MNTGAFSFYLFSIRSNAIIKPENRLRSVMKRMKWKQTFIINTLLPLLTLKMFLRFFALCPVYENKKGEW